ncbi:S8 family serine peptidase [Streptomyces nogalater]
MAACDHGTHVAGIAAGNGTGLTGAPKNGVAPGADIVAIQVFSQFNTEEFCGGVALRGQLPERPAQGPGACAEAQAGGYADRRGQPQPGQRPLHHRLRQ